MSSGLLPGRSVRPHPSRNKVSPDTKHPPTWKHCEPGVCPGVWTRSISTSPTRTMSPARWLTRSVALTPVVRITQGTSFSFT